MPGEGAPAPAPAPEATPEAELPASSPSGFDQLNPTLPDAMQAPFDLIINEVAHGQVVVVLAEDDVFVRRQDLVDIDVKRLGGREREFFGEKMLSLKSVSPPLKFQLDEREIALRITAPVNLLPTTVVDLGTIRGQIDYQERTSGFFNYALRTDDFTGLDAYQEIGASHGGNLLLSSAYLSTYHEPVRGMTSFTINERETKRRLIFGDALVNSGNLGSNVFLGGWTLQRTYDLDPYAITSPRIGFQGETMTPATVDVYVNGARVRSEDIAPGAFQLNNLRVGGGAGTAAYVLRDVYGREQTISLPFYIAGNVLVQGIDEFSYSIGVLRDNTAAESWDYNRLAVLGRHRYGVTDQVTVSARAEATDRVINGGAGLTAMTPIGQIEFDVSGSGERGEHGGSGVAGFGSYSYLSTQFSAGVFGTLISNRYATINTPAASERLVHSVGAYQGTPIGRRYSVTANAQYAQYRDNGRYFRCGASTSARLFGYLSASLSGGYGVSTMEPTEWNVTLSLSYVFEGNHVALAQQRVTNGDGALDFGMTRSTPAGPGYGYRVASTIDETTSFAANTQVQNGSGRLTAGYNLQNRFDVTTHHVSLGAAGALAVVPGVGLFPSLPISDAFGVVRVPNVRGVRGYANNQEIGRTNRDGNLLVPNVLSYYGNQLRIDPNDVPYEYAIDKTILTIAPPQRGVAVAEFPVTRPYFYRGSVMVTQAGKRVVPKYGQVRVELAEGQALSPLGEHGEFDLTGVAPGEHRVYVDHLGGTCFFDVDFKGAEQTIIDLGELVCNQR